MIDITPGPEQQQLVESVADFLSGQLPVERLSPDGPKTKQESELWGDICELGWFGMSLSEEAGGAGFGFADEVLVFREIGRYLLSPNILATRLALHAACYAGDPQLVEELLSGNCRASVAVAKSGAKLEAGEAQGDFQLIDTEQSQLLCIWNEQGLAVFDRGVFPSAEAVKSLDWSSSIGVVGVDKLKPRLWVAADEHPLPCQATILGASILVGNAEGTRDMAVEYAKIREQFNKPIGSFQAVKHRCADMALRAETAWAQTLFASLTLSEGYATSAYEAHGARILAADAAIKNGESNIQVHGGIGFTAEAYPHLFIKRAHLYNQIGGNLRYHQRQLIDLDNLGI